MKKKTYQSVGLGKENFE